MFASFNYQLVTRAHKFSTCAHKLFNLCSQVTGANNAIIIMHVIYIVTREHAFMIALLVPLHKLVTCACTQVNSAQYLEDCAHKLVTYMHTLLTCTHNLVTWYAQLSNMCAQVIKLRTQLNLVTCV